MDLQLAGKTVLVTGSTSGIGRGCAEVLASEGCNIIIDSHGNRERAESVANDIASMYSVQAIGLQADVSIEEDVERLFDEAHKAFGVIDYLVNNAGGISGGKPDFTPFQDSTTKIWEGTLALSLSGAYWCTRRFSKDLISQGVEGAVVNVSSKSAVLSSSVGNVAYVSAKAGVIGLTRGSAKELIAHGIRVNGIIPGYVRTRANYADETDPRTQAKKRMLPTGDFASPRDMGYAVAMLLSPLARQINGAMLDCTGGTLV
jgi:NAD(P)-dependent dehydrogenase (short-subunit alcohol dehydrogenase family)